MSSIEARSIQSDLSLLRAVAMQIPIRTAVDQLHLARIREERLGNIDWGISSLSNEPVRHLRLDISENPSGHPPSDAIGE
jgi:hypothetical protein